MTGHPTATALYGAPKLLWATTTHPNPHCRATDCQQTRCGSYRRYQQGGRWIGVYLPRPQDWDSIWIERSLDALMARIDADHAKRSAAKAQAALQVAA